MQSRLQKAYSNNGESFYVYAPKQRGQVKDQLRYIGRYIRRPAIGINRIEEYDGQYVTFRYQDKQDQKEKMETITVEEFIARLIRHIPDEQFKTIRHYGMYSRRTKTLCKKLLTTWQKEKRKWIVKTQKMLRKQTWRERVIASGSKDPLICSRCQCYYEYKGEVCLEAGKLVIKVALCSQAKDYLERVIHYLTGIEAPQKEKQKEKKLQINKRIKEHQLCLFSMR